MATSFNAFQLSAIRIKDADMEDVFYVFPDQRQKSEPLPESLDDAYGYGFLTISLWDSKFAMWYLNIANQEYTGPLEKMQRILFDWATAEGYQYCD